MALSERVSDRRPALELDTGLLWGKVSANHDRELIRLVHLRDFDEAEAEKKIRASYNLIEPKAHREGRLFSSTDHPVSLLLMQAIRDKRGTKLGGSSSTTFTIYSGQLKAYCRNSSMLGGSAEDAAEGGNSLARQIIKVKDADAVIVDLFMRLLKQGGYFCQHPYRLVWADPAPEGEEFDLINVNKDSKLAHVGVFKLASKFDCPFAIAYTTDRLRRRVARELASNYPLKYRNYFKLIETLADAANPGHMFSILVTALRLDLHRLKQAEQYEALMATMETVPTFKAQWIALDTELQQRPDSEEDARGEATRDENANPAKKRKVDDDLNLEKCRDPQTLESLVEGGSESEYHADETRKWLWELEHEMDAKEAGVVSSGHKGPHKPISEPTAKLTGITMGGIPKVSLFGSALPKSSHSEAKTEEKSTK